jgi:hypothetical protein
MLEYESLFYYYSGTLPTSEYILFVKDKPCMETGPSYLISWLIFERKLDGDQVNVSNCSECYVSYKVFTEIFIGFRGIGVYIIFFGNFYKPGYIMTSSLLETKETHRPVARDI